MTTSRSGSTRPLNAHRPSLATVLNQPATRQAGASSNERRPLRRSSQGPTANATTDAPVEDEAPDLRPGDPRNGRAAPAPRPRTLLSHPSERESHRSPA